MSKTFLSQLQKTLTEIGTKNGLAPPQSQDVLDPLLHEYLVATTGASIFEKRKKAALAKLIEHDQLELIEKTVNNVALTKIAQNINVFNAENYTLNLQVKSPSEKLDKVALVNSLAKLGVSSDIIKRALAAATTHNAPAKSFTVTPV